MSYSFGSRVSVAGLALASLLALAELPGCGAGPDQDSDLDALEEDEDQAPAKDGGKPSTRTDAGTKPSTPRSDAGTRPTTPSVDGTGSTPPNPLTPGDRTPSPDNIKECPPVAPENPVGSCIGVPIYATCSYTTYNCICDWYHWICI